MNLIPSLRFNPLARLRQRLGAALAVLAGALGCCLCGVFMAFVVAPGQALQAARVARLPLADAAGVAAAAPGDDLLVSGVLDGNAPLLDDSPLVAYAEEVWVVTATGGEDGEASGEPFGRWQSQVVSVPPLTLLVGEAPVVLQAASGLRLGGALRETIVPSEGGLVAEDAQGQALPAGSRRYRGLVNGDLVTVLGQKAAAGGLIPQHLFAGDRVAFAASQRQAASGLWYSGLASIVAAPFVLVTGLLAVLFWRRG